MSQEDLDSPSRAAGYNSIAFGGGMALEDGEIAMGPHFNLKANGDIYKDGRLLGTDKEIVDALRDAVRLVFTRTAESARAILESLQIVEAPGDRCGNTQKLPDGSPCPGCRACR